MDICRFCKACSLWQPFGQTDRKALRRATRLLDTYRFNNFMTTLQYMDISGLTFLIMAGLIGLTILAITYVGLYFLYKWLTKKGFRIVGIVLFLGFSTYWIYFIYTAIYPTDSFYYSEFKEVTLREVPKTAVILNKGASYPDFHGDYCSASLMTMSTDDYLTLLNDLTNDKRITKNRPEEYIGSNELDEVMENYKNEQIIHSFTRTIPGEEDQYYYIGFLDDQKTIVISVCIS